MKRKSKQTVQVCAVMTVLLISINSFSQIQPVIQTTPLINVSQLKVISPTSFNKSISPKYVEATKKFIKSTTKTSLANNTSAISTVTLNKGGVEGSAPSQTTVSAPSTSDGYTCVSRNVNERTDYFRQPVFTQGEFIYPGALLDARSIINNQLGYYSLPANYQRKPYRISANLFTMVGTPQSPSEMIGDNEDYSLASYRTAKSLIMNRNLNANPPIEAFIEYIEATTREEVAIKLGYNVSTNIPAELTALLTGIPVGANLNVSAGTVASQINDKSRIILKINYNFYSMDASPLNDDPANFIAPAPGSDLPANVVFVSSVLYGSTGYVYFESDKSVSELIATLEETVGVAGPANQGSASVSISAETRAKFASTVTKMVAYGKGLSVAPGSSVPVTNLENLLSLIGTLRSWGPNNQGSPIAYTMNFLKDGVQAVVSYSTQFPNKICTAPDLNDLKFDVELELESLAISNVRDLDGTEDLYGSIDFRNLKANTRTNSTITNLFTKTEANANTNNYKNGTAPMDKRIKLITNLSFNELRNLELTVGGKLSDDEGILGSRVFKCSNCSVFSGEYGTRTLKFIELTNTQSSINSLQNNGLFQNVKFGSDNFFELIFFESNNENDGKVRALFKVWIKPHL